eukprot:TRINITY_DN9732_c0_g1_i1.p2 TRINITY_DN9732_c0_g1~~TRINITY_DN9732_c0_g1_i1.p2  ORF type:complete len:116 (-),score=4.05 TRINITY_DN9732_c0_g1_i1:17-364(-)
MLMGEAVAVAVVCISSRRMTCAAAYSRFRRGVLAWADYRSRPLPAWGAVGASVEAVVFAKACCPHGSIAVEDAGEWQRRQHELRRGALAAALAPQDARTPLRDGSGIYVRVSRRR